MSHDDPTDEQVRRLLADARHTEPVPSDVAERLDGVLADLRADRPLRPAVTDLAAARRRRRVRTMLIAAAAVVVVGLGVDQLRGMETSGSDSSSSDSAGGVAGPAAEELERDERPVDEFGAQFDGTDLNGARVEADDFGRKALRLRVQRSAGAMQYLTAAKSPCTGGDAGAGDAVRIRYGGSPAVLVYRAPRGDTQIVDLYICGRDGIARTITLPAP
ncbi:hypothetical protein [Nocardioides pyridinolyticus]